MKAAFVIHWILWTLLLLSWPFDMLIALFQRKTPEPVDAGFALTLAVMAVAVLGLTFALKWFLLRFLIRPDRVTIPSPAAVALYIGAGLLIWALVKSVEIFGFVLFLQSGSMPHYLAFWIPGLAALLFHTPTLLDPRRAWVKLHAGIFSPSVEALVSPRFPAAGNPYAPPASEPATIPVVSTAPGSPIKGVALGLLVDIGGSIVAGVLFSGVYAFLLARRGMGMEEIGTVIANSPPLSWFSIIAFVSGCVISILGGYVCERTGRRGYGSGWIMWIIGTVALLLLMWPAMESPGQRVIESVAALLSIMAGIRLARRKGAVAAAPARG